jgi:hypothetical protein
VSATQVPKKRYLTVLDIVMNLGLLVQLTSCAIVFLHADMPNMADGEVRTHLYAVTRENVEVVEGMFLKYVIFVWILGNFLLVLAWRVVESFEPYFPQLRELEVHTQDWLHDALGSAEGSKPVGAYTAYRMGETLKTTRCVLDAEGQLSEQETS